MDATEASVREILRTVGKMPADLPADADLFAAGVIDSFAMLNLIMRIEEAHGFIVPNDKLVVQYFGTVDGIRRLIGELKADQG